MKLRNFNKKLNNNQNKVWEEMINNKKNRNKNNK